ENHQDGWNVSLHISSPRKARETPGGPFWSCRRGPYCTPQSWGWKRHFPSSRRTKHRTFEAPLPRSSRMVRAIIVARTVAIFGSGLVIAEGVLGTADDIGRAKHLRYAFDFLKV